MERWVRKVIYCFIYVFKKLFAPSTAICGHNFSTFSTSISPFARNVKKCAIQCAIYSCFERSRALCRNSTEDKFPHLHRDFLLIGCLGSIIDYIFFYYFVKIEWNAWWCIVDWGDTLLKKVCETLLTGNLLAQNVFYDPLRLDGGEMVRSLYVMRVVAFLHKTVTASNNFKLSPGKEIRREKMAKNSD